MFRKKFVGKPTISVIITTFNSQETIEELLLSLKKQTYKNFEIVVVDDGSSDKTVEIARNYTEKVFPRAHAERSVQRNFGVSKTKGEHLLILDSDMKLEKDVLRGCMNAFRQDSKLGALVIAEKSFGVGFWTQFKVFEREFYVGEETIEAARFFDRKLFLKFGGYDTSITGPEDWDLPLRMKKTGIKIGRIDSFILHNEGQFSPLKSAKKKFYYAMHSREYLRRHIEMITLQGNLFLRPVFFKKWRKLVSRPFLALGMFFVRFVEMAGAALGFAWGIIK